VTPALLAANVLIRFLTRDDVARAEAARVLLGRAAGGEFELRVTALAFTEVVWVLEKVYRWPRADIATRLVPALALPGVVVDDTAVLQQALPLYGSLNIDFIDAYQAASGLAAGVPLFFSYDRDLNRVPGITRQEP
jgi:predicted nucleic-acid-binding protein